MPAKGVETKEGQIKASLSFLENLLGDYRPRDFATPDEGRLVRLTIAAVRAFSEARNEE